MRSTWRDRDRDFQKHLPDGETTQSQLQMILLKTQTDNKPIPGLDPDSYSQCYGSQQSIDCDEVYPGIYIGDVATAKNKLYLNKLGITHLLNCAAGQGFGFANTDISKYFYTAAEFIDEAVSTGGKAFVHCMVGMSRSATCVLAYLMIKKEMLAVDAIQTVRKNRCIQPNMGFIRQLAQLDNQLRRQRL
ncbi:dual specificity phosphatase 29 isoform X3 [Ptiloglossa arizonensis]|uniref:dual specificity phosphatase 29 isoform X3 n=1 Tax=Ptiloglossa arizonensis TaxID=3350558 RepID=UPI003F9FAFD5